MLLRYSSRVLDIAKYFVITRILSPSDLGSFILATTIVITFEALSDTGFHFAFIQKQVNIRLYAKTLWVLSVVRGLVIGFIVILSAPFLSDFFRSEGLLYLLIIISLVPMVKGFQSPYVILFQKNLDFKKEFYFRILPLIAASLLSIGLAYLMRDASGLVLAVVIGSIAEVLLSFYVTDTRFSHPFSMKRAKYLFNYGKYLTAGSIFTLLITQVDSLFVGRIFGTSVLAAYELSFKLANVAFSEITDVVSRVSFPLFSKIQKNKDFLFSVFKKNVAAVALPASIITAFLFVFAEQVLTIAFGEQYADASVLLRILSVYGFLRAVVGPTGPLFLSVGKPRITTVMSIVNFVVLVIILYPMSEAYGVNGVGLAMTVSYAIILPYVIYSVREVFKKNLSTKIS